MRFLSAWVVAVCVVAEASAQTTFQLAPALALEAEDFHIESGWKVVEEPFGVHPISGERLLGLDAANENASAYRDVNIPESGPYRLWVRYAYVPFHETRFRVVVEQKGRRMLDRVMGTKNSPRFGLGVPLAKAQHDPADGEENFFDEGVAVPDLKAGRARIYLRSTAQSHEPGVAAPRRVDLLYLTRDTADGWRKHYAQHTKLYPLLDAFRASCGARYEIRIRNRGDKAADFHIAHVYNRAPWGVSEAEPVRGVAPDAWSAWIPLRMQDTTRFGLMRCSGSAKAFEVEIRPLTPNPSPLSTGERGAEERTLSSDGTVQVYLPPYPGNGAKIITPSEELDAILAELKKTPTIGKKPTQPLCFGGWMPLGLENAYGRKYAALYAALGLRSLHPALSGPAVLPNLRAVGIPLSKSWTAGGYRNPPTCGNIDQARLTLTRLDLQGQLRFFDYGDDWTFADWLQMRLQDDIEQAKQQNQKVKPIGVLARMWFDWLRSNRTDVPLNEYWLAKWGPFNVGRVRPDSSAEAARENPRLYVDSLLFYEDLVLRYVAQGRQEVKKALGDDVLCGASCSCSPFFYPHTARYVKSFRMGAADLARNSAAFGQTEQALPMIHGYIAEHFRAGLRDNSNGVLRAYTLPQTPGEDNSAFLRSAFSQLAHGATMLDFHALGMNETFAENHLDHRAHDRYRAVREVTHAVGLVEDLLPQARPLPSPVALLVSASTERWDFAGVAEDSADYALTGANFRKLRLNAHLDRLGLWTAFTFLGVSPDLLMEEDISEKGLKNYKVLVVVGDCQPPDLAPVLEAWVRQGGVVLATANAGRYDPYREATPVFEELFGLQARRSEERVSFFRPRQELPLLKPFDRIVCPGGELPQLGTREHIVPAKDATILARFADDKEPALLDRRLGKGHILYVAALPGVASLWSALQPSAMPDGAAATFSLPTQFNGGTKALLQLVLRAAHVQPSLEATPTLVDARLLQAPGGYLLPLANYEKAIGQKVILRLRIGEKIGKVTSAYHGELAVKEENGRLVVTIPHLGYGDVLRLERAAK